MTHTLSALWNQDQLVKARKLLNINDTNDDVELEELGQTGIRKVEVALFGHIDLPLTGDFLDEAKQAIVYWVLTNWKARKNNKDLADYYLKLYKECIEGIKQAAKNTPTSRTKRVSVAQEYETELLFSQQKKF